MYWNIYVREIGASKAGISLNLIPVFTATINWFIGGKITIAKIIDGIFVFTSVYLTYGLVEKIS